MMNKFGYAISQPSLPQSNFEVYVPKIHNGRRVHLFLMFKKILMHVIILNFPYLKQNKTNFS